MWAARLLAWYGAARRPLPWRENPSPYAVWVSEVMLQQTQAATVAPYYRRFLERFPDLPALAAADLDDVLRLWEGLGYYSRARHLHAAARQILADGGELPRTVCGLRKIRGIGDYTAAAIASIAFGEAVPAVDGNVVRVASRLWGLRGDGRTPRFRQAIARRLAAAMDAAAPGDFNQALMELGARVCRPRRPACPDCPLADDCHARAAGRPERWPPRRPRVRTPHIHVAVGLVRRRGRLLIAKRRLDQMLGGLWELPGGKVQPGETPAQAVVREIREEVGLAVRVADALPPVRHAYSHFSITLHAFECRTGPGKATAIVPAAVLWVAPARLAEFAFPAATRKVFALASAPAAAPGAPSGARAAGVRRRPRGP